MGTPSSGAPLRLAELLATVSLATDLAHDVPAESALRDAILAVRLARLAGWPESELSDVYYLALLYHVGCTGAVAIQSRASGGDDVATRHWVAEADLADVPAMLRITVTRLARGWGAADWARGIGAMAAGPGDTAEAFARIADVAGRLAARLGAGPVVAAALGCTYARWDGKVFPGVPHGEAQPAVARLVHLVHVAQRYERLGGLRAADAVVRERSGGELDPELARLWLQNSGDLIAGLGEDSVWDEALASEPAPFRRVAASHLDDVTRALADFVDLKSPYTHGHSASVARLVEGAAAGAGLSAADASTVRRAALVHDLGNVSVPDRVLTKAGPLTPSEWTRVRLHAYHTERIMSVSPSLRPSGEIAALHHERMDGSGYHRGLPASALPLAARLLMAAEVYQSMSEARGWRPARRPAEAAAELRRMAAAGELDRRAVEAVLAAAGERPAGGRRAWPAGLTDREVDVLRLLARGSSNREIAHALHVSEATVHTHVINLYGKAGVRTRAGATLFALEHDLIQVGIQPNG